jgi:hypothetical protein
VLPLSSPPCFRCALMFALVLPFPLLCS